jgi:hypothetical protein
MGQLDDLTFRVEQWDANGNLEAVISASVDLTVARAAFKAAVESGDRARRSFSDKRRA